MPLVICLIMIISLSIGLSLFGYGLIDGTPNWKEKLYYIIFGSVILSLVVMYLVNLFIRILSLGFNIGIVS